MDGVRLDVTPFLERFRSGFSSRPIPLRKVGREAEYPVVDETGAAFDVSALWGDLVGPGLTRERASDGMIVGLNGLQYSYASEVGTGRLKSSRAPVMICSSFRRTTTPLCPGWSKWPPSTALESSASEYSR